MSFNFKDVYPTVSSITFDPNYLSLGVTGKPSGLQGPTEGQVWYDSVNKNLYAFIGGQVVSFTGGAANVNYTNTATPITATNPSSAATLFSYAFPAGALNVANRVIYLFGSGYYTTASGQTPTVTVAVTLGDGTNTRTLLTWTSGATTASASNIPWNFDGYIFTDSTGTSGTMLSHGTLNLTLGTSAGAATGSYLDTNHAASSALNLTLATTLNITTTMSSSNAGNSVTEDSLLVQVS